MRNRAFNTGRRLAFLPILLVGVWYVLWHTALLDVIMEFFLAGVVPGTNTVVSPDMIMGFSAGGGIGLLTVLMWAAALKIRAKKQSKPVELMELPAPQPVVAPVSRLPIVAVQPATFVRSMRRTPSRHKPIRAKKPKPIVVIKRKPVRRYKGRVMGVVAFAFRCLVFGMLAPIRFVIFVAQVALFLLRVWWHVILLLLSGVYFVAFTLVASYVIVIGWVSMHMAAFAKLGAKNAVAVSKLTWQWAEPRLRRADRWLEIQTHRFVGWLWHKIRTSEKTRLLMRIVGDKRHASLRVAADTDTSWPAVKRRFHKARSVIH